MPPTDLTIDCGGTNIRLAAVVDGALENVEVAPTRADLDAEALREHFLFVLTDYVRRYPPPGGIASINIAIAGQIDSQRGVVLASPNLPAWRNAPLAAWVRERFGVPVYVDNDARAAALGELNALGGDVRELVCMTWGTGIGGGIVAGGSLLRGAANAAAEIGHMIHEPWGRVCHCGKQGCYEAYAGGWSMERAARELAAQTGDEALSADPTTRGVFTLAAEGHPLALGIRNRALEALGALAASLVVVFNPQWLVLGGGISMRFPEVAAHISSSVNAMALPVDREVLQIKVSDLGDEAALRGACLLGRYAA